MKSDKLNDAIGMIKDEYIEEAHKNKEKKSFALSWELVGKLAVAFACVCLVVTIVPAMFSAKSSAPKDAAAPEAVDNGYVAMDMASTATYEEDGGIAEYDVDLKSNKKLIVSSWMELETLNLDDTVSTLSDNINRLGGYFQSTSIYNTGYYRTYDAVIRIPAEKYDELITVVKGSGNATYFNEQVDDITDAYTDIEARLNSLKVEEEKVLEFYDKATSLSELMEVESRLSDIRYQIDSYENSIKNYDLQINYSTLNITIRETKAYSENNESFGTKLLNAFKTGWSNFTNGIKDFVIDVAYNIWTIILILVIVIIVIVTYKKIRNKKAG